MPQPLLGTGGWGLLKYEGPGPIALPLPWASGPRPGLNRHRQQDGVALLLVQVLSVAWVRHGGEEAHEAQQCGK